jgi:hypothetical protein
MNADDLIKLAEQFVHAGDEVRAAALVGASYDFVLKEYRDKPRFSLWYGGRLASFWVKEVGVWLGATKGVEVDLIPAEREVYVSRWTRALDFKRPARVGFSFSCDDWSSGLVKAYLYDQEGAVEHWGFFEGFEVLRAALREAIMGQLKEELEGRDGNSDNYAVNLACWLAWVNEGAMVQHSE